MKQAILSLFLIIVITGCGLSGNDAKLEGTYKECSMLGGSAHTRYSFSQDGKFSYLFEDNEDDASIYKKGTWKISNRELFLNVNKIGRNEIDSKDTANLSEKYLIFHDEDYKCIRLDSDDKLCHEGQCLTTKIYH